jgi:hypothetical protein
MKDINDLGLIDAIHCQTPELAKKIVELNGDRYEIYENVIGEDFYYLPKLYDWCILKYVEKQNFTIHQASEFLPSEEEETLEDAAKKYADEHLPVEERFERSKCKMDFIAGAKWQAQQSNQPIENTLTEDQKFFRELVASVSNGLGADKRNDPSYRDTLVSSSMNLAKEIFTAVKQHENNG